MRIVRIAIPSIMAPALLVAAACSSGGGTGGGNPPGNCTAANAVHTNAISISNFAFVPACALVSSGATVTWTNTDSVSHSATSDPAMPDTFDSGTLGHGTTFSHPFNTPGTTNYHCVFHSSMHASIVVQ